MADDVVRRESPSAPLPLAKGGPEGLPRAEAGPTTPLDPPPERGEVRSGGYPLRVSLPLAKGESEGVLAATSSAEGISADSSEGGEVPAGVAAGDCWNRIGVSGDRSCPELETHIHCRNCPVYAGAARAFFDRPAPDGYLAEWTDWLAGAPAPGEDPEDDASSATRGEVVSLLIFRLRGEWLAVATRAVAEVTTPRPVHRIPHRSDEILTGLVNLRGQLQLCISLHGLLGVGGEEGPRPEAAESGPAGSMAPKPRLVVLRDRERSETWVFPADEVLGIHRVARSRLGAVPATLANPAVSYSQAILPWEGRSVGFLDEQRIFSALRSFDQ